MNLSAFKAYDIRGKYPEEVNEDLAYLIGRASAKYFKAKTIVVGRDMRVSSPSLAKKIIDGLICEGVSAIDIGMCTTPMLNFAIKNYGCDGGIMVSASHNPGGDNAFKIIDKYIVQLDDAEGLNYIKDLIEAGFGECANTGKIVQENVLADYARHITKTIGAIQPLKIVADYGNGVGAISASPIFEEYKLNVRELFANSDGTFPNHPANPHDLANFTDLISSVKELGANFGVFYDGDADRANFVDDLGRIVPVDLLVALLAQQEIKQKGPGKVYFDLRFSKAVPTFLKKVGGIPVMMRVGNPFYKRVLKRDGGIMGAEFAGHIMFPDNYNIDDGLFVTLKVIKLLNAENQKLSELIDSVNVFQTSPEQSMEAKNPATVFARIIDAFPDAKQVDLDGVYLDFKDGFVSVRQSQSERQLFRIRVEAATKDAMQDRFDKVKRIVAEG
jgi:phosphomannomutase